MSASQAAAETTDARMVPALLSISKSMRALHGLKLTELGLHNGQDELLMVVNEKGITVSLAADQLAIRPSTVSKMMDRLVAKGLMERSGDVKDGRRTVLRITPAGVEARKQALKLNQALELELSKTFADLAPSIANSLEECASMLSTRLRRLR